MIYTRWTHLHFLLETFLLVATLIGTNAPASWALTPPPAYELIILPPLPGYQNSYASDLNNQGVVAGSSYTHQILQARSVSWSGGPAVPLPIGNSHATTVNELNHFAGNEISGSGTQTHGYFYDGTVVDDIHDPLIPSVGNFSVASELNNLDQIAGYAAAGGASQRSAFLWNGGSAILLGTLGGTESAALGLNNVGQVVGYSETPNGNDRAFLWTDANGNNASDAGEMDQLPDMGLSSVGWDVNDSGQVAGWVLNRSFQRKPVIWNDANSFSPLPLLPGATEGEPLAINNQGVAVGVSTGGVATLWRDGQVYDLNDLIAPNGGFFLTRATAINDQGWIVGEGIFPAVASRGFLLISVPEPGSGLLCIGVLFACVGYMRPERKGGVRCVAATVFAIDQKGNSAG